MTGIAPPSPRGMTLPPGGFSPFASLYCVIQLLVTLNALPLRLIISRYTVGDNPKANFYKRADWRLDAISADAALTQRELEFGLIDPWLAGEHIAPVDVHPHLRVCPECIEADLHSAIFQCRFVQRCPVHGCLLLDQCPICKLVRPYALSSIERLRHPFACPCRNAEWALMASAIRQRESREEVHRQLLKFLSWSLSARSAISVGQASCGPLSCVDGQYQLVHSQGGRIETLATQCALMKGPALDQGLNLSPGQTTYPSVTLFLGARFSSASGSTKTPARTIERCSREDGLLAAHRTISDAVDGLEHYARARHPKCYGWQQALQKPRDLVAEAICEIVAAVAAIRDLRWAEPGHVGQIYEQALQEVKGILRSKAPIAQDFAPGIAAILTSSQVLSEVTKVAREVRIKGTAYAVESAARKINRGTLAYLSYTLAIDNHPVLPRISCAISTAGSLSDAWADLCFTKEAHEIDTHKLYLAAVERQMDIARRINELRSKA